MSSCVRPLGALAVALWLILCRLDTLSAETFRHITAEPDAGATIDGMGDLKEGDVTYRVIYKPTPAQTGVRNPG